MIETRDVVGARGRRGIERLVKRLGFAGRIGEHAESNGLGETPGRLFGLGAHRTLQLWGCEIPRDRSPREVAAALVRRALSRRPGRPVLVFAWHRGCAELTLAGRTQGPSGPTVRTLRIDRSAPGRTDVEVLRALAPRGEESGAELAARVGLALGRESVSRSFFRQFRAHRDRLAEALEGVPHGTARATRHRRALALLQMSRLVFLYFLQRRGWLDGSPRFFARLIAEPGSTRASVYRSRLRVLFFEVLNTPVTRRTVAARRLGRIPYLNGGLFEKDALECRYPGLDVPDTALVPLFDELLERYNFTVREDRPDDPGTSVDPEMLGQVFEELMESDARKGAGAFYTPRPLVSLIVDDVLVAALAAQSGVALRRVRRALEEPAAVGSLPAEDRRALSQAARALKVLDPACGSGAFLLGVLQRLLALRAALSPEASRSTLSRAIVQTNLFGIDIDRGAIKLCELRLWLAIVCEAGDSLAPLPNLDHRIRQGNALLPPLPFQRGRAPLPVEPVRRLESLRRKYPAASGAEKRTLQKEIREAERALALSLVETRLAENARAARQRFAEARDLFGGRSPSRDDRRFLRRLRLERGRLLRWRRRIHEADELPFFTPEVHLSDVLERGGFHAVVGNPPWIRWQRIARDDRVRLVERYEVFAHAAWQRGARLGGVTGGFAAQPDLAAAFVEASLALCRPDGQLGLLLPAKLLQCLSGGGLRQRLARATVRRLEDWSRAPTDLFRADTYPIALWLRAAPTPGSGVPVRVRSHLGQRPRCCDGKASELRVIPDDPASPWWLVTRHQREALRMLQGSTRPLGEWKLGRLGRGVLTGANECFLLDQVEPVDDQTVQVTDRHGRSGRVEAGVVRPVVRGRDVQAFRIRTRQWMVWTHEAGGTPRADLPPLLTEWLAPHRSRLQRRPDVGASPWWSLFRTRGAASEHRLVWNDVGRRLEAAALPPDAAVPLNSVYYLAVPSEEWSQVLTAWLNSAPIRAFAGALAEPAKGGYRRFFSWVLGCCPGPGALRARERSTLAALARRGAAGEDVSTALDQCVASAIGLKAEQLEVLRAMVGSVR